MVTHLSEPGNKISKRKTSSNVSREKEVRSVKKDSSGRFTCVCAQKSVTEFPAEFVGGRHFGCLE